MRITSTKLIMLINMMLILSGINFGQSTLQGIVTDSLTHEQLFGASVILLGTSQGEATNFNGEYKIPNIAAGTYKIRISYVGYETKTISFPISGDKTIDLFVELSTRKIEGKTITVTAQAQGQLAAINEQLSSNKIVNIVSADKMKELPDANIAESIGRLPGVSLDRTNGEADKVIIRGLSAQFNKVTIEGVPMVSTNGGRAMGSTSYGSSSYSSDRSIDLSMLSDDLVKGVELSKSLRANMDADAIGGTINLTLKEAPKGLHYDIQSNGGYNDLTSSWKNYKVSGSVSNRFLDNAVGIRLQLTAEDKALPSQQFNAGYDNVSPVTSRDPLTGKIILSDIRNTNSARLTVDDLDRKRYEGSIILDYESDFIDVLFLNTYNQKKDHDERYDNSINFQATGDGLFTKLYSISDMKTEERTHSLQSKLKFWGTELNASISYTKGDYNNPGNVFPFIQVGTPNPYKANAYVYANPSSLMAIAGSDNPANFYLESPERTNNSLNDNDYDVKLDYTIPFKVSDSFSGKFYAGGKFHEMSRNNAGKSINFDLMYGGSDARRNQFLSWLQQNINPSDKGMNANYGISGMNFMDNNYTAPTFLNGKYSIDNWRYNLGLLNNIANQFYQANSIAYFQDATQTYNTLYSGDEKLRAFYIMSDLNLGTNLTIVPGLRYEELRNSYGAYIVYTDASNQDGLAGTRPFWRLMNTTNVNYFPSVNVKYKANENLQLMGAYYVSAARPDFSDLSPLIDYNVNGTINASGNPNLKPAIAQNFDLGASLFSNSIGLFSANLFYKVIKDLVYSIPSYMLSKRNDIVNAPSDILQRLPGFEYFDSTFIGRNPAATTSIPINNPAKAYMRGIELSWQTHFWYLPGILSGIVLDLNLSLINSHTFYPYFDQASAVKDTLWNTAHDRVKKVEYYQAYSTRAGSVLNQPKAIYNAIIGWDYLGFSSRISFRYQETTLTGLDAKFSLADTYYDNVLLIDISLKQKVIGNLAVFTNFTNIGSHVDNYYYSSPKGSLPTSSQTYGFNAQFGISYNY